MKKLKVDLELLLQSLLFNNEGLCKEYLDTVTGDIINIPEDIDKVVKGILPQESLPDWKQDLLSDGYAITNDKEHRYIFIPAVDIICSNIDIEEFIARKINDPHLASKLSNCLNEKNPMRSFKNTLSYNAELLDEWYDYEEKQGEKFAKKWLKELGIQTL
ncbi:hypothetical protein SH2C18_50630 [Clostridium sediminicola]|uniref:UPF0158 family protein n=1 Tax=Clostridium sediminicola TaxID=3114879 RepID=UPI0031F22173